MGITGGAKWTLWRVSLDRVWVERHTGKPSQKYLNALSALYG